MGPLKVWPVEDSHWSNKFTLLRPGWHQVLLYEWTETGLLYNWAKQSVFHNSHQKHWRSLNFIWINKCQKRWCPHFSILRGSCFLTFFYTSKIELSRAFCCSSQAKPQRIQVCYSSPNSWVWVVRWWKFQQIHQPFTIWHYFFCFGHSATNCFVYICLFVVGCSKCHIHSSQ